MPAKPPTRRVLLPEREEPLQQTALVHHLDAAHVQAERTDRRLGSASFSSTSTCTPCSRNSLASIMPVGPPPAMITSKIWNPNPRNSLSGLPGCVRNLKCGGEPDQYSALITK